MTLVALHSPHDIKKKLPLSTPMQAAIMQSRQTIKNILDGVDPRFLVIVGPCSVHDPEACLDYARQLKQLALSTSETLFIIMRVYVEKPRTGLGWKGYINDPYLNETYHIQEGILNARHLMQRIQTIGLPIASEILNPISYLYFHDLLSWGSIGARTSESQIHREIASHLDLPIGIKNTTSGNIRAAAHGIACAYRAQSFMGVNENNYIDIIQSQGNPYAHLVLRGGESGANYMEDNIIQAERMLSELQLAHCIIIDCAHENAASDPSNQIHVVENVLHQKMSGRTSIKGIMLESFLKAGHQPLLNNFDQLNYGQSITDACLNWQDTKELLLSLHQRHQYAT
jgi:3-deoxy-7-phosphoheptulonate synthase